LKAFSLIQVRAVLVTIIIIEGRIIGSACAGLQIFHQHPLKQRIGIFSTPRPQMFIICFTEIFNHSQSILQPLTRIVMSSINYYMLQNLMIHFTLLQDLKGLFQMPLHLYLLVVASIHSLLLIKINNKGLLLININKHFQYSMIKLHHYLGFYISTYISMW
jgi:hypothetical protein